MIAVDRHHTICQTGNFMTLVGLADFHFLCDTKDDEKAYQPLDYSAWKYMKYCTKEIQDPLNKGFFGKPFFYGAADWTEMDRGAIRKSDRNLHKNDLLAKQSLIKSTLRNYILPKMRALINKNDFIGGVAGNHLIHLNDKEYANSDEYLIKKLGGKYCGEGKMLINFHLTMGAQHCLKKILIVHGSKAGSKAAIIKELQAMYFQYGKIDLLIKAHAHDPMAGFYAKYELPNSETGRLSKQETLVMCLGSTRDGEKMGYDDYTERMNCQPVANRYPMAIFHAYKPIENNRTMVIKIRPYIM